ncbi:hypothetical protein TVAG_331340 [Trichomonas vaginalis G3]|uniref:Uncharacterized protein n=1 Tax=Trichomonas vaginalis (strain ATCC PRA-98 / G3) TaxID=412133 RepID=A2FRJ6_TRIV3|nr:hypothetical protein TVAGG3_1060940 [Trichomonas vaginalis G3]EAX92458.1 hypothetical protein TVAG_331340 [Trichomonas vaginalis G3]KAI5494681.1 hypothetical protein TVAGG3_1060940 [Trichomonas vaginalis G3]|eukprot:XP_001305388.1 hypothetical protein [Trichomonas vaginalis G3]
MRPLCITEEDGSETYWLIENGTSKSVDLENEEEDFPEEYGREITYEDSRIVKGQDDPMSKYVISIINTLVESITRVIGRPIQKINLVFGINDYNQIWLNRNSILEFSDKCFENAILQSKDASRLNNIFVVEVSKQVPNGKCFLSTQNCSHPQNHLKLLEILYYKSIQAFPSLNKKKLFNFLIRRIEEIDQTLIDKDVTCCLPCYLRIHSAIKLLNNDLVKRVSTKRLSPINDLLKYQAIHSNQFSSTQVSHFPFLVQKELNNPINSPYSSPVHEIHKLASSQTSEYAGKLKLAVLQTYQPSKQKYPTKRQINHKDRIKKWDIYELPEYSPLPPTFSQKLAPKVYQNKLEKPHTSNLAVSYK